NRSRQAENHGSELKRIELTGDGSVVPPVEVSVTKKEVEPEVAPVVAPDEPEIRKKQDIHPGHPLLGHPERRKPSEEAAKDCEHAQRVFGTFFQLGKIQPAQA